MSGIAALRYLTCVAQGRLLKWHVSHGNAKKAIMEPYWKGLLVERVNRSVYPTREHAQTDVAQYIEFRYNTQRLHSALGYRTPREVYTEYLKRQIAARYSN